MSEQDRVFLETNRAEDFAFDERVAKVFDNMVSRSVPFYTEVQRIQSDLVMDFLPEEAGVVCDLGCSTGTTIEYLTKHQKCPESTRFIGYDNADSMLDKARDKLSGANSGRKSVVAVGRSEPPSRIASLQCGYP